MSLGAGHPGQSHEAALFGCEDEFLAVAVPFLEGGRDAAEPTIVALGSRNAALVRAAIGDVAGITFLPRKEHYTRPAIAIRSYRTRFAEYVAAGATQIRVIGDVPHPGMGAAWDRWARYEAAVNHAFDDFPLWGVCSYDTRTTPDEVLDEVVRTHPHLATADGGRRANDRYLDPAAFLAQRPPAPPDPLQHTAPLLDLLGPTPGEARLAVAALPATLASAVVEDFVQAVHEVVVNARVHGHPPVRLQAWTAPDRVVVTVHDEGCGTTDPFAGLLPPREAGRGFGLWITHQLCSDVSLTSSEDGFTVRLVAGTPHLP